ncbi:MAG: glycosyltransferase family 4 protein [Opitutae bacterium]|nr:glycosyltransferase family 4 protein [Opitutae bacterium]
MLRLAVSRLDRDGRLLDYTWERTEQAFDRRVARGLHTGLSGIYAFEYSSLATITRARALGLRVAYDVPAPEPRFVQAILDREMEQFPELVTPWHRWTAEREEERIARRHTEFQRAHTVIAASEFTRRSFAPAGLDIAKVRVVPYGAPPPCALDDALPRADAGAPLTVIWAGTFSVRKGAHYLIEAWRAGNLGRHARLFVFGAVELPARVLRPLPDGVELRGSIPRAELMAHYRASDALIFPTLCDGFGMVATEAWSQGLPVITTDRAGAADLVQPQRNGLLIPAGNAAAIRESIEWCLAHRAELRAMREASLATAARWQWSDYRRALATVLRAAGFFPPP